MPPIYTYECEDKHAHEITHPIKECDIERVCPTCAKTMQRVLQSIPFLLQDGGSGWFKDQYSRLGTSIKG